MSIICEIVRLCMIKIVKSCAGLLGRCEHDFDDDFDVYVCAYVCVFFVLFFTLMMSDVQDHTNIATVLPVPL
jgi:hypothetical protein